MRIALAILILLLTAHTAVSAEVIHIRQRDLVYYGDVIDLRGITGWTDTLAWWSSSSSPSYDQPDQFVKIRKYERFEVTRDLHPGMYYQWYGDNERAPVGVFYVVPRTRMVQENVTIEPTKEPEAQKMSRVQPAAVADIIIARGNNLSYYANESCRAWLIGPTIGIMGHPAENGTLNLTALSVAPGTYALLLQYPDRNGMYEVYPTEDRWVESVWKGVEGFWWEPMGADVLLVKLKAMFADAEHFHGSVKEKRILVEDPRIEITGIDEVQPGKILVRGITNLAANDSIKVIWDADRNVIPVDRARHTVLTWARGEDVGAYRVFDAILDISMEEQASGNHHIMAETMDGHQAVVEFYVRETFTPFETPNASLRFVANSPFIPTPTPMIIEKPITVTVTQIVTVPVTPAYETVLAAERQAAAEEREKLEGRILSWVAGSVFLLMGGFVAYRGGRYLKDVARRARK